MEDMANGEGIAPRAAKPFSLLYFIDIFCLIYIRSLGEVFYLRLAYVLNYYGGIDA